MKKILTLIVFLAYNSIMFSQEKDSLIIGEWKVICIETHNYYYNSVNDSLSYSKEFKEMIPGLMKSYGYKDLAAFEELTKKDNTNDKFIFENNGIYLRKKGNKILREGNYTVNNSKKIISFKDKNEQERTIEYFIEKGLLHLTMNFKGGAQIKSKSIYLKPTKFILQKTTTL